MKAISLFAGIGGFDLAMQRADIATVAQVEIDPQCRAVLAQHWPDVARHDDIRTFHATPGQADIVCGGFPCQDLSVAGQRLGFAGVRSSLFFEMVRIIHECRPLYVIWENVPGLLSSNNGRDFASVLMALDNIGYSGAWTMLDAQYFGLAQRRRRVFGVFARGSGGAGRCAEILSLGPRLRGDTQPGGEAGESIAYAIAAGAGGSKFGSGRQGQDTLIAKPLGAHHARQDLDNDTYVVGSLQSHSQRHGHAMTTQQAAESGHIIAFESRVARNGRGAPDTITPPLKAQSGNTGKGDGAPLVAYTIQSNDGGEHRRQDRPNGGLYVNETETALTVGTTDLTAIVQPTFGVRRLTPRECERLQGFPDDWTAAQSDSARYRMLGNAVAVPVVEWLMQRVAESMGVGR